MKYGGIHFSDDIQFIIICRTPLNGIIGLTRLLKDTTLSKDQQEMLEMIETSEGCLLELINDVLDLSKIDAGLMELNLQPTHASKILQSVLNVVSVTAKSKNIDVDLAIDQPYPCIMTDVSKLKRVVMNLAGNAVKVSINPNCYILKPSWI